MVVAQSSTVSSSPGYGSIKGVVVESDDRPLKGATVYVLPALDMRHQLRAQTDADGKYLIAGVPIGEAYISVFDEDKGYPYNFFSFFQNPGQETHKFVISHQGETAEVNFKLGRKAGRLQIEILDDDGSPITQTADLIFTRPDVPGYYRLAAGNTASLLVPPVKFHIAVNVPGFKQWNYENKKTGGLIQPRPAETVKMTVRLIRDEK